ncbi:glycosyltransferase family 2 protein [Kibdelosporangium philippinense]|uniref:Glycosyltransferase family 2 protein n=1 Tax=Kibdelosporangium philippinense TaxID=211113 RepID=A0ABS8ZDB6_9PSEU|nr:glycosyltransferase family 2 protein [Kibdelosporangium philippinense]MCE7005522.1 glycosyltransferase family 2 protein [Kibdelosporangium philippinense]
MRVAVVIVTYNSADALGSCLASLPDGLDGVDLTEIVVADNASRDSTCEIAKNFTKLPVRVVDLGRNAGYAAGINAGIASLGSYDAVLVINPDVRIRPGAVAKLAEVFRRPRVGIAAPKLENTDGSLQPSLRRPPTVLRAWAEALIGGNRAGRWGTLGELITDPQRYDLAGPATWATGGVLMISAEAVLTAGRWDESFLLYGEETDFALRAGSLGLMTWYTPDAVFEHDGGESGTNPMLWALLTVNRTRVVRRHYGFWAWAGYYAAVVVGEGIRAASGRPTAKLALEWLLKPSRRLRVLPQ